MLMIKLIDEPAVLESLGAARFGPCTEGYVAMDGPAYLGHTLFTVQNGMATVVDTSVSHAAHPEELDTVLRAVAAAISRGAGAFAVDTQNPSLAAWWQGRFGETAGPCAAVDVIACAGD